MAVQVLHPAERRPQAPPAAVEQPAAAAGQVLALGALMASMRGAGASD